MKRIFIIIASVIVVIGIGLIVYFVFFSPSTAHLTVGTAPFADTGSGTASAVPTAPATNVTGNAGTVVAPNLVEITSAPVSAGEVAFDVVPPPAATTTSLSSASSTVTTTTSSATASDIEVRYIDRQSGNMYAYMARARSLSRITDKTVPGIQQASWLPDGSMVFVSFLTETNSAEQLESYALPADGSNGYFLPEELSQATVIGSSSVFTLAASTDNSVGTISNINGGSSRQVFTSPLASIIVHAAGSGLVAVTKAASEVGGYAFSINQSGLFTPIIGPLAGLTVLPSPSGQFLLYRYTDGSNFHMNVLNLVSGTVTNLPLATIADDKCVWTSDSSAVYCAVPSSFTGNLPDDWYQGAVSFTDRIWRIDLNSRLATLVVDPYKQGGARIDAVNLTLDPATQVLFFRNKKDSSLWAYTL